MFTLCLGTTPHKTTWDEPGDPHDGNFCMEDGLPDCGGCHGTSPINYGKTDQWEALKERMETGTCPTCGPLRIEWTKVETEGKPDMWYGRGHPINGGA